MSDLKRSLSATLIQQEQAYSGSETENDETARAQQVAQKKNMQEYAVVFIADENQTNQKAFDFALQTAKNFDAKLVLVYAAPRKPVPDSYIEYAKAEGIRNYEWLYYKDIANSKLESLSRKAREAGIEYTAQVRIGNAKSALSFFMSDVRSIVVLNKLARRSRLRRSITKIFTHDVERVGVQVIVF